MNKIEYKIGIIPLIEEICRVFTSSGIRRPVNEPDRIKKMFEGSNLVVTAWIDNKLINLWLICYLSTFELNSIN